MPALDFFPHGPNMANKGIYSLGHVEIQRYDSDLQKMLSETISHSDLI